MKNTSPDFRKVPLAQKPFFSLQSTPSNSNLLSNTSVRRTQKRYVTVCETEDLGKRRIETTEITILEEEYPLWASPTLQTLQMPLPSDMTLPENRGDSKKFIASNFLNRVPKPIKWTVCFVAPIFGRWGFQRAWSQVSPLVKELFLE